MSSTYTQTPLTTPSRYPERATYDRAVAHELLDQEYVCHLGFVVDGRPRVLPTLFVRVDDTIYLHGSTAARWPLASRADGGLPICVTVTAIDALVLARSQFHHSANYRSLVAHGVAHLVTDETAKRAAMTALVEKIGAGRSQDSRPPTPAELAKTAVLALPLTEVSVKRRDAGALDDPEDLALPYWAGIVPLVTTHGFGVPADGVTVPAPAYVRARSAWLDRPILRGKHVALGPLRVEDAPELRVAVDDEEIHRYQAVPHSVDDAGMVEVIKGALQQLADGELVPWIIRDAGTGEVVGTTSFHDLNEARETLAIGRTQVARSRWRTAVNTETKLLLMTHAFETLGVGRLEWHADVNNARSIAAITRLGARREGTFYRHKRRVDGGFRDSAIFAMTIDEWPAAKKQLVARLAAGEDGRHVAGHN